jgi:hypothetical protein
MKTITETERQELEEKLRKACYGTAFKHPLPELFLTATAGKLNVTYPDMGGPKLGVYVKMQVLLPHVQPDGVVFVLVLGDFHLN